MQSSVNKLSPDEMATKKRKMVECLHEIQSLLGSKTEANENQVHQTLQTVVNRIQKMQSET